MNSPQLINKYKAAHNKLILLDYDGALVNRYTKPDNDVPSAHLLNNLTRLGTMPQTKVIIFTGKGQHDIDSFIGHLPVDIIAEHGAMRKENNTWQQQAVNNTFWKKNVIPLFNKITLLCPGSYVEEKNFSISWDYKNVEKASGFAQSRKLIHHLESIMHFYNLKVLDGNKVVEIMCMDMGKDMAISKIIEENDYDYILSIGDKTDEEIFEVLAYNSDVATVRTGNENTFSKYSLDSIHSVIALLNNLSSAE